MRHSPLLRSPLFRDVLVPAACVALALAWPLSVYVAGPLAMPAALVGAAAAILMVRQPVYGIALALAAWPFRRIDVTLPEAGTVQPLKYLIPALAVGLIVYALVSARSHQGERARPAPGVLIALTVFVAVAMLASLLGLDARRSIGELGQLVAIGALVTAAALLCRQASDALVVAGGAVAGLLLAGLQGIGQHARGQFSDIAFAFEGETVNRIAGSFGHPNGYAGYLAALIPVAAALAWQRNVPVWLRALSGTAVAVALPALAWSYTRGAMLGLAAGVLVWLVLVRPRAALPVLAAFVLVVGVAAPTIRERLQDVNSTDVGLRQDLWGSALALYSERPVLGAGMTNFGDAYAGLPRIPDHSTQRRLLHGDEVLTPPHANNAYLTVLAELGLTGLAALFVVLGTMLAAAGRGVRSREPVVAAVALGLGAGTLAVAAHNVLEYTLLQTLAPLLVIAVAVAMRARDA